MTWPGTDSPRRRRVLFFIYTNPGAYPPLLHAIQILADAGWEVMVLGTGSYGADTLVLEADRRVRQRSLSFVSTGWKQRLNFLRFSLWVLGWTLWWRPDWVYASDANASPAGLAASFVPGVSVLYHEHDSPPIDSEERQGLMVRLVWWARSALARRSRVNVLPQQERAQWFERTARPRGPVLRVWNCPSRAEATQPAACSTGSFIVYFHGAITPPLVPFTVIDALRRLPPDVRLRIAGYRTIGAATYVEELQARARELDVEDRLEMVGPLPRGALLKQARECHVGIAFTPKETDNINIKWLVGASNKAFDYMACGLPLVVPRLTDWERTYVAPGYALAADPDNVDDVASALRWLYEHPEERRRMGERARQRIIDEWNYEQQFAPVLAALDGTAESVRS